jgi:hypothetical protein
MVDLRGKTRFLSRDELTAVEIFELYGAGMPACPP